MYFTIFSLINFIAFFFKLVHWHLNGRAKLASAVIAEALVIPIYKYTCRKILAPVFMCTRRLWLSVCLLPTAYLSGGLFSVIHLLTTYVHMYVCVVSFRLASFLVSPVFYSLTEWPLAYRFLFYMIFTIIVFCFFFLHNSIFPLPTARAFFKFFFNCYYISICAFFILVFRSFAVCCIFAVSLPF